MKRRFEKRKSSAAPEVEWPNVCAILSKKARLVDGDLNKV